MRPLRWATVAIAAAVAFTVYSSPQIIRGVILAVTPRHHPSGEG